MSPSFSINRAPVMTLWAAVVAERLGFDRDAAASLGRVLAGMNAATKAQAIGLAEPGEDAKPERSRRPDPEDAGEAVELMGRMVPVVETEDGLRATSKGRPSSAEASHAYLKSKFGAHLAATRAAMQTLARSMPRETLRAGAMGLYEAFRPVVPRGTRGWGAKGTLDLAQIRALAAGKAKAPRATASRPTRASGKAATARAKSTAKKTARKKATRKTTARKATRRAR
jgi:hypothetical protein